MQFTFQATYPIPKYVPKKLYKSLSKCPECIRLSKMGDNFYGPKALEVLGHPNEINCVLCNKAYCWEIVYKAGKGLNDWFDTWGWVEK